MAAVFAGNDEFKSAEQNQHACKDRQADHAFEFGPVFHGINVVILSESGKWQWGRITSVL